MPKQYEEKSIEDSKEVLKSLKTIFRSVYGHKISIEITDKVSSMAFDAKNKKILWGVSFVDYLLKQFPDNGLDAVMFGALHEGMHYVDYLDNPKFFLDNMHSEKPGSIRANAKLWCSEFTSTREDKLNGYSEKKIEEFFFSVIFNFYNCIDDIWVNKKVIDSFGKFSTDKSIISDIYKVLFPSVIDPDTHSINVTSLPLHEQFGIFPLVFAMLKRLSTQKYNVAEVLKVIFQKTLKGIMQITEPKNTAKERYAYYNTKLIPHLKKLIFAQVDELISQMDENQQGEQGEQGSHQEKPQSLDDIFGKNDLSHPSISKEELEELLAGDPVENAQNESNKKIERALSQANIGRPREVEDIDEAREFYYSVLDEISSTVQLYSEKLRSQLEGYSSDIIVETEYRQAGALDIKELLKRAPQVFAGEIPETLPPVYKRDFESRDPDQIPSIHVAFALDCSGSMRDDMEYVKKFFICLSRLFITYQTYLESPDDMLVTLVVYDHEADKLMPIKSDLHVHEQFIATLPYIYAMGNNNEHKAFAKFEDSNHDKKILVWITDGGTENPELSRDYLEPLINSGWEMVAIGIGGHSNLEHWSDLFKGYPDIKGYNTLLEIIYQELTKNI